MTEDSALDTLEDRTQAPNQQDYADWWSPHQDDPDQLVGVVVEAHDTKFNEDDDAKPVFTIRSIGDPSAYDRGVERSTRTHVQLVRGLNQQNVELGDLVNLRYTGLEATDSGNAANTYEVGVVKQSEWKDMAEADMLHETLEMGRGVLADTRGEEPDVANENDAQTELEEAVSGNDSDIDDNVLEFAEGTIDMQSGEIAVEKLDKMLNDVRSFDVSVDEVADALDYTVEDGVVKR